MELFNLQVVALIGMSLMLVVIGVWSARFAAARFVMLGLFSGMIGVTFGASTKLLGQAKPVGLEWFAPQAEEAVIVNGYLMEGRGIFLTVIWENNEPQLYVLPWDLDAAQQLQNAMSEADENGTQAKMRMPMRDVSERDEAVFYAPPQPELAPKKVPEPGIRLG